MWSWVKCVWPRLNPFNPNWPIYILTTFTFEKPYQKCSRFNAGWSTFFLPFYIQSWVSIGRRYETLRSYWLARTQLTPWIRRRKRRRRRQAQCFLLYPMIITNVEILIIIIIIMLYLCRLFTKSAQILDIHCYMIGYEASVLIISSITGKTKIFNHLKTPVSLLN